jgi:hypothetical protein
MKQIIAITVVAFALINPIKAQVIRIYRDGQFKEASVKQLSDQGIYIGSAWVTRDEYDSIEVLSNGPYVKELQRFLIGSHVNTDLYSANATVRPEEEIDTTQSIMLRKHESEIQDLKLQIRNSNPGAAPQILGGLALTTYFILQQSYANEIKSGNLKAKAPSGFIAAAGAGLMTIGFVVNIGDKPKKTK